MEEAIGNFMFCVYVLECSDGSLYTGYTKDLEKRLKLHSEGKASKYTRARLPVKLRAKWPFRTRREAVRAEAAFKRLPRREKLEKIRDVPI